MLCRYAVAEFNGKELYFAYTVSAMFKVMDLLDGGEIMDLLDGRDEEGFARFCRVVRILAECGAQVRESEGFPRPAVPGEAELTACMRPVEYRAVKEAALNAILLGYGREIVDTDEEIDLELAEMEKK